jgi:hypothetical protein
LPGNPFVGLLAFLYACNCNYQIHSKFTKMKSLKMPVVVVLTLLSFTVVAQDSTAHKEKTHQHQSANMKYSCPMHAEVTSNKPGKCSKCGMDLVKPGKHALKMYECPMHPDVASDKPGKCPKCGMALTEKNADTQHQ